MFRPYEVEKVWEICFGGGEMTVERHHKPVVTGTKDRRVEHGLKYFHMIYTTATVYRQI